MLGNYQSVERSLSVLVPTTFAKRMASGLLSVCAPEYLVRSASTKPSLTAWLNILAYANKQSPNKLIGISELLQKHYAEYGRSFFSRYDYEEVSSEGAQKLVDNLNEHIAKGSLANTTHKSSSTGQSFTVSETLNFDYTDPVDGSVSKNQGQIVQFSDGSRVVFRLSGTGSQGATVRLYVERYVSKEKGVKELSTETAEGLKGLIEVALEISKLKEYLGREKPTVIT
jgi:phosphoglucomutase